MPASATRTFHPSWDVSDSLSIASITGVARHGSSDPCYRLVGSGNGECVWRAFNSAAGPVTLRLQRIAGGVRAAAWGPGAAWAMDALPAMLADADDADGFDVAGFAAGVWHPRLRACARDLFQRWRPAAVAPLVDHLVASILEQRVTGIEAHRAWRYLAVNFGSPAPGPASDIPAGLRVPPAPQQWQTIPSWQWHRAGVDSARSDTIMRAVRRLDHREPSAVLATSTPARSPHAGPLATSDTTPVQHGLQTYVQSLASVRGIGGWTMALVRQAVLGDADAVQFGDFHTSHDVVHAVTGEHRGDDRRLAEVLEPWAGHRYRVVRLVELAGISAPRRGPRLAPADHRQW